MNKYDKHNAFGRAAMQAVIAMIEMINATQNLTHIDYTDKGDNPEDGWEIDIEASSFYHSEVIALANALELSVTICDNHHRYGDEKKGRETLIRIYATYLFKEED